jgi:hypothetical protein
MQNIWRPPIVLLTWSHPFLFTSVVKTELCVKGLRNKVSLNSSLYTSKFYLVYIFNAVHVLVQYLCFTCCIFHKIVFYVSFHLFSLEILLSNINIANLTSFAWHVFAQDFNIPFCVWYVYYVSYSCALKMHFIKAYLDKNIQKPQIICMQLIKASI